MSFQKKIFFSLALMIMAHAYSMEKEKNSISPFVPAVASFAIARYTPELAAQMLENNSIAQAIIPPLIKYGGYTLSAYFAKNALNISCSDIISKENQKKFLRASLNFAPALLCHPTLAHAAAQAASALGTQTMLLSSTSDIATSCWTAPTLMAVGGLSSAYLVNKNICNGSLLQVGTINTIKKLYKDAKPYAFAAPLLITYNAEALKNLVLCQMPNSIGGNLKSDLGLAIKNTLYWGGIGCAAYLFAKHSLGLATQQYVKEKVQKLTDLINLANQKAGKLMTFIRTSKNQVTDLQEKSDQTHTSLIAFRNTTDNNFKNISTVLKCFTDNNEETKKSVLTLLTVTKNLETQTETTKDMVNGLTQALNQLKIEHENTINQLQADLKSGNQEFIKKITQQDHIVQDSIQNLEELCNQEQQDLQKIKNDLVKLTRLLQEHCQTYVVNESTIDAITQEVQNASCNLDTMIESLGIKIEEEDDEEPAELGCSSDS